MLQLGRAIMVRLTPLSPDNAMWRRDLAWFDGQIVELTRARSAPTAKQRLSAIRHLFDWLVVGQVMPANPASSVRGPSHVVKRGKTPLLSPEEARRVLDAIDVSTHAGLRDRALIALMVFSFARIGAALAMKVEDVFVQNRRLWVRLREKGGKRHEMPCHHNLETYLQAYRVPRATWSPASVRRQEESRDRWTWYPRSIGSSAVVRRFKNGPRRHPPLAARGPQRRPSDRRRALGRRAERNDDEAGPLGRMKLAAAGGGCRRPPQCQNCFEGNPVDK
jgi:integrase